MHLARHGLQHDRGQSAIHRGDNGPYDTLCIVASVRRLRIREHIDEFRFACDIPPRTVMFPRREPHPRFPRSEQVYCGSVG